MLDPSRNDGSPEQRSPWSEHDQVASSSSPALDSFAKSDNQNQLDYLVPEEERADAGTPGETQLPEDPVEDLAQNFSQASTFSGPGMEGSMRTACLQAVERFEAQRDWQPDVVQRVLAELNAVVKANTPSPADQLKREELLQRTCALVEEGLGDWVGMHVEPYGSFVSGLYTPSGDVDIAIEGHRRDRFGGPEVPVVELDKEEKAQILKALSKKLERKRMTKGRIERILFARVPILKYTDLVTGIDCDVSVGSGCARFKSTVLRFLGQLDRRFIALTCLVKKWARTHNMNDASNGTFNSFALTLMVAFHLQTQQPPILPPLCEIFQQAADSVAKDALVRPLHGGRQAAPGVLEAAHARLPEYQGYGAANSATVLELFASFFASFQVAIESWTNKQKMRPVRASTWSGDWTYRRWGKNYLFGVEDPFDITDNCSRTIFAKALPQIVRAFASASYALERLSSADGAMRVLRHLFVEPNPQFLPPPLARQSRNQRQAQQAAAAAANQAVRGLGPRGPPRDQLRQEAIQILDLAPGPGSAFVPSCIPVTPPMSHSVHLQVTSPPRSCLGSLIGAMATHRSCAPRQSPMAKP
ncbi:hypothetical protein WJX72_008402 [[Myrmecia] bisecta]|uniref:Poly(A) RNA polymerase mitochondrial-like central palm domain-containing protein n=1 Tax=[Myrmecia] bisecta TaxID=41462 RepID=A0AAW1QRU1_9CHLO